MLIVAVAGLPHSRQQWVDLVILCGFVRGRSGTFCALLRWISPPPSRRRAEQV